MRVAMISLDREVLTQDIGDVRERHLAYGERIGELVMIVGTFRRPQLSATRLSPHLTVIPTGSLNRYTLVGDAYRIGAEEGRRAGFDLVVTQDPFSTGLVGYLLKRRFSVPLVINNHSYFFDNPAWLAEHSPRNAILNRLGKFLITRADGLRVVNTAEKEKYLALGVSTQRIWLLPTPVAVDQFREPLPAHALATLRERLGVGQRRILLWVGNPTQRAKDIPTLLTSVRRTVDSGAPVTLVAVGDFTQTPEYGRLAKRLGLQEHVVFVGPVPHDDLPMYYHLCDVYIHSSRFEGLSKVMVEAAAAGKPIVSTRVPGVESVVIDGITGRLAPVGDADALARCALELLQDPVRRTEMGRRAHQLVLDQFHRNSMIDAVIQMWRTVAAPRTDQRPAQAPGTSYPGKVR